MCPFIHANYLVLGAAIFASFIFGFLWYGPLFGKTWVKLTGLKKEDNKVRPWAFPLTILGTVLTVFILAYFIQIYKPYCNFGAAFFIWLGFYLPPLISALVWERKPFDLFILNATFYFLNLQLIAVILTYWL